MSLPSASNTLEDVVRDALGVARRDLGALRRGLRGQPTAVWLLLALGLLVPLLPVWGLRSYQQARERFVAQQAGLELARERILAAALAAPLARRDRSTLEALLATALEDDSIQSVAVAGARGRVLVRRERAAAGAPARGTAESRWWPVGPAGTGGGLWLRRVAISDPPLLAVLDRQLWIAWGTATAALAAAVPLAVVLVRWHRERRQALELRRAAEAERLALEDSLTGMVNRRGIDAVLTELIAGVVGNPGAYVAVCLIDLDDFGRVAEHHGDAVADQLLREVATRLRHCARSNDILGRLGADAFVCVLDPCTIPEAPVLLSDRILQALGRPFLLGGIELTMGASIGIVLADGRALLSPSILLYRADAAMQTAKAEGKNRWHRVRLDAAPALEPPPAAAPPPAAPPPEGDPEGPSA